MFEIKSLDINRSWSFLEKDNWHTKFLHISTTAAVSLLGLWSNVVYQYFNINRTGSTFFNMYDVNFFLELKC